MLDSYELLCGKVDSASSARFTWKVLSRLFNDQAFRAGTPACPSSRRWVILGAGGREGAGEVGGGKFLAGPRWYNAKIFLEQMMGFSLQCYESLVVGLAVASGSPCADRASRERDNPKV